MIRVEDQVWARWRELEHLRKPAIGLLLVSGASRRVVLRAVREAAAEAVAAFDPGDELPDGVDERWAGVCKAVAARDGIVWEILEGPDDFRALLERIVDGLERRGIEGHFELARVAGVAEIPEKVALAECRMR